LIPLDKTVPINQAMKVDDLMEFERKNGGLYDHLKDGLEFP